MKKIDSGQTQVLLKRAAEGDVSAARILLASHRDQLRRMVQCRLDPRLKTRVDPSDVVQDAMTNAAQRLPEFVRHGGEHFYVWLRKIAWERLIQLHRHHVQAEKRSVNREVALPIKLSGESVITLSKLLPGKSATPLSKVVRREMIDRLRSELDQLKEVDREVLVLRHLEQLSVKEVAEVLGLSEAATQSRYRRAVERLHDRLKGSDL